MRYHLSNRSPLPKRGALPEKWKQIIASQVQKALAEISAGR